MTFVPVVLFVYARSEHLRRALTSLRENRVPRLIVYSDGPPTPEKAPAVEEVRRILHEIDWCGVDICERKENLGLGASIRTGMTEVLQTYDAAIVFEDDLVCAPGTYDYLCAAMSHYWNEPQVMSVAGWTHPRVRPPIPESEAYFDGRFACWGWGTWRRAWEGMERPASEILAVCRQKGLDPARYGSDLVTMAMEESARGVWAARFALLHLLRGGLCFHPPWSLVRNIGFDSTATNTTQENAGLWDLPSFRDCPSLPSPWPEPKEHVLQAKLWRHVYDLSDLVPRRTHVRSRLFERLRRGVLTWSDPEGMHRLYLRRSIRDALGRWHEGSFQTAVDFGCGDRPYELEIRDVAFKVIGVDIGRNEMADILVEPGNRIPIADGTADLVTSFQVLEHVQDYHTYLSEIARITRLGGTLVLSAPSVWPFHPHPNDYRRWMLPGLEDDLAAAGFKVRKTWPVLNPVSTAFQYFLSVCRYCLWSRGWPLRWFVKFLAMCLNPLIFLSERFLRRTVSVGAGNYVVLAERT